MRNNIVVDGIRESPHETWTKDKVRKTITEKLQMDQRNIEVGRAQRLQKPVTSPGARPMSIVVKLLRFKDGCSGESQELERNQHLPQRGVL